MYGRLIPAADTSNEESYDVIPSLTFFLSDDYLSYLNPFLAILEWYLSIYDFDSSV